jgi:hypothetical protein
MIATDGFAMTIVVLVQVQVQLKLRHPNCRRLVWWDHRRPFGTQHDHVARQVSVLGDNNNSITTTPQIPKLVVDFQLE